jgi:predicted MarR family transcription regulator
MSERMYAAIVQDYEAALTRVERRRAEEIVKRAHISDKDLRNAEVELALKDEVDAFNVFRVEIAAAQAELHERWIAAHELLSVMRAGAQSEEPPNLKEAA